MAGGTLLLETELSILACLSGGRERPRVRSSVKKRRGYEEHPVPVSASAELRRCNQAGLLLFINHIPLIGKRLRAGPNTGNIGILVSLSANICRFSGFGLAPALRFLFLLLLAVLFPLALEKTRWFCSSWHTSTTDVRGAPWGVLR